MKSKIIDQKKNNYFGREEFLLEIVNDFTPTKKEIIDEIGKPENLTVINRIKSSFGEKKFIANVFVYNNESMKNKHTTVPKKIRMEMEKKEKEELKKKKEERKILKSKEELEITE